MNRKNEKGTKKTTGVERNTIRSYFVRLFEKYDIRNQEKFVRFCKWLIFISLITLETLSLLHSLGEALLLKDWHNVIEISVVQGVLTICVGLRLFVVQKQTVGNVILYTINGLAIFGFMLIAESSVVLLAYMLFLTEFYIDASKPKASAYWVGFSIPCYVAIYMIRLFLLDNTVMPLTEVLAQSIGGIFALLVHFIVVNVALAFYRQFLRLDKTLNELEESKKELEKAYEAVAEVTALEERQRIAKEIHDTAGHSLTTVIMQTEAAKRIVENDPEGAKNKIVAANLQAKHALEELRESVHVLSGREQTPTLQTALADIIHESTDETGIVIRSEIEEIEVSNAKQRFLCNTLKEGISNGLRHGGATAFWFELKSEGGRIKFLLSDNGKGVEGGIKLGFGLRTMQERARALGGELTVLSELEEGFELHIDLPLDEA